MKKSESEPVASPRAAVNVAERRTTSRAVKRIPGRLSLPGGDEMSCSIKEVSISGFRILVPCSVERGVHARVRLAGESPCELDDPAKEKALTVPGVIVWCARRGRLSTHECGFSFHQMDDAARDRLVEYLMAEYRIDFQDAAEKRSRVRFPSQYVVEVESPAYRGLAIMLDISDSGMRLLSHERLPGDSPLTVSFRFGQDDPLGIEGRSVRCRKMTNTDAFETGVTFPGIEEGARSSIIKGISHLMRRKSEELEKLFRLQG